MEATPYHPKIAAFFRACGIAAESPEALLEAYRLLLTIIEAFITENKHREHNAFVEILLQQGLSLIQGFLRRLQDDGNNIEALFLRNKFLSKPVAAKHPVQHMTVVQDAHKVALEATKRLQSLHACWIEKASEPLQLVTLDIMHLIRQLLATMRNAQQKFEALEKAATTAKTTSCGPSGTLHPKKAALRAVMQAYYLGAFPSVTDKFLLYGGGHGSEHSTCHLPYNALEATPEALLRQSTYNVLHGGGRVHKVPRWRKRV